MEHQTLVGDVVTVRLRQILPQFVQTDLQVSCAMDRARNVLNAHHGALVPVFPTGRALHLREGRPSHHEGA